MAKTYPLNIVIGATDQATAKIRAVQERISGLMKPLQRVTASVASFSERIGLTRVGTEALAVGRTLGVMAIAAGGAAVAFGALSLRTADTVGALADTADRLRISTDALQAWTYGFEQADVSQEQFTRSLDQLVKNLGDAKLNMGRAVPIFRGLGIDPKNFQAVDQLLPVLADRLSKISDPAKRAAIAERLLGEAGATMALKLAEGPQALRDMEEAARSAGAVIDGSVIKSADVLVDRLNSLRRTFAGVSGNILGRLYPSLIKIAEALQAAIVKYQPQLTAWAETFAGNLPANVDRLVAAFNELATAAAPFVTAIGWVVDNFGAANTLLAAMAAIIGGKLIIAVAALGVNLAALGVSMTVAFAAPALIVAGVLAAVAAGYYLIKNWSTISDVIGGTIEQIGINFSLLWDGVKTAALDAVNWITEKFQWLVDNHPLVRAFRGVRSLFSDGGSPAGGTPAGAAPIAGGLLNAPATPRQSLDVTVDFANMPAGARANAVTTGDIPLQLNRGYAMPGVN